jgi:hypothetical protein
MMDAGVAWLFTALEAAARTAHRQRPTRSQPGDAPHRPDGHVAAPMV